MVLTSKKTAHCSEKAWNKNIKLQGAVATAEKCRVLHAAEAQKTLEAIMVWEEAKKRMERGRWSWDEAEKVTRREGKMLLVRDEEGGNTDKGDWQVRFTVCVRKLQQQ